MTLYEHKDKVITDFFNNVSWEARYKYFIDKIPQHDDNLVVNHVTCNVNRCTTKIWYNIQIKDNKMFLTIQGDSAIIQGVGNVISEVFTDKTLEEIATYNENIIEVLCISDFISYDAVQKFDRIIFEIKELAKESLSLEPS